MQSQKGFTLIELMLSIIMGAVTTAAATTMYITSQKTLVAQNSLSSNQLSVDKGLNFIGQQVRQSNMGRQNYMTTQTSPGAPIIVSASNYLYSFVVAKEALSQNNTGPSYMTVGSDQLVIRYTPRDLNGYDCEGRAINSINRDVIERYYVRDSDSGVGLSLACDAGRFIKSPTPMIVDIGTGSVELVPNVDLFKVKLITSTMASDGTELTRVADISSYKTFAADRKIIGVKLGVVSHSNEAVGHAGTTAIVGLGDRVGAGSSYMKLFDQTYTFNPSVIDSAKKYRYSTSVRTISLYDGSGSYN